MLDEHISAISVTLVNQNDEKTDLVLRKKTTIKQLRDQLDSSYSYKLIYRGRVLDDDDDDATIEAIGLGDGATIHCVSKPLRNTEDHSNDVRRIPSSENTGFTLTSSSTTLNHAAETLQVDTADSDPHSESTIPSFDQVPPMQAGSTPQQSSVTVQSRNDISLEGSMEPLHQSLVTVRTILCSLNWLSSPEGGLTGPPLSFIDRTTGILKPPEEASTAAAVSTENCTEEDYSRVVDEISRTRATIARLRSQIEVTEAGGNPEELLTLLREIGPIINSLPRPNAIQETDTFKTSNATHRYFAIGQWIDILDTSDQWLEGTIINIRNEQQELLIHYNGWSSTWDEWVPFVSARIAPFRSHTWHCTSNIAPCPIPVNSLPNVPRVGLPPKIRNSSPGTDVSLENSKSLIEFARNGPFVHTLMTPSGKAEVKVAQDDIRLILPHFNDVMDVVCILLSRLSNLGLEQIRREARREASMAGVAPEEIYAVSGREEARAMRDLDFKLGFEDRTELAVVAHHVSPLLDRVGKMMSEMAVHVSRLAVSPRFAPAASTFERRNRSLLDPEVESVRTAIDGVSIEAKQSTFSHKLYGRYVNSATLIGSISSGYTQLMHSIPTVRDATMLISQPGFGVRGSNDGSYSVLEKYFQSMLNMRVMIMSLFAIQRPT
jgi:hypothetical protein